MAQQIYYAMYCDALKRNMRLGFIGTSQRKLKMFISKAIENGNMYYGISPEGDPVYRKKQAKEFRKDWDTCSGGNGMPILSRRELNDRLNYGYIGFCSDNSSIC